MLSSLISTRSLNRVPSRLCRGRHTWKGMAGFSFFFSFSLLVFFLPAYSNALELIGRSFQAGILQCRPNKRMQELGGWSRRNMVDGINLTTSSGKKGIIRWKQWHCPKNKEKIFHSCWNNVVTIRSQSQERSFKKVSLSADKACVR
jgi:hypothetical protein